MLNAPLASRGHCLSNELWIQAFACRTAKAGRFGPSHKLLHCTRIVTLKMEADSDASCSSDISGPLAIE